jgi:hypothetical protein
MAGPNTGTKRQGASESTPKDAKSALNQLVELVNTAELANMVVDETKRKPLLPKLGHACSYLSNRGMQGVVTGFHSELARKFHERGAKTTEQNILDHLLEQEELKHLFAHGMYGLTILHVILDPNTYPKQGDHSRFDFERVKPLIAFIFRLHPDLHSETKSLSHGYGPPLFDVLNGDQLDADTKKCIVLFFCNKPDKKAKSSTLGSLGSRAAITSLAKMVKLDLPSSYDDPPPQLTRHAVHLAADTGVEFSDEILESIRAASPTSSPTCLALADSDGWTSLHIALTRPFSKEKVWWAERLAKLEPSSLKVLAPKRFEGTIVDPSKRKTPLQHFYDQVELEENDRKHDKTSAETSFDIKELEALKDTLKRECMANFNPDICKSIMNNRDSGMLAWLLV